MCSLSWQKQPRAFWSSQRNYTCSILAITSITSNSLAAAENTKVDPESILSQTNEMLAVNGDIIALLGNSQQELSTRRQFSLQSAFPKEITLICEAKIPASSMLLGDDTNQVVKQVMEHFRATQNRSSAHSSHIYHPYHTALLQALKGERLSYVFSPDGTLISASTAPHCGAIPQRQCQQKKAFF